METQEMKMVDVTLHIDEETSQADREAIRDQLLSLDGVMAADYKNDTPHLFVIEYNPDVISATALRQAVVRRGVHAELISM